MQALAKTNIAVTVQFRKYYLLFAAALLVGVIHSAPYLMFIVSAGHRYAGITMDLVNDQTTYLARIQEVIDGHWSVSSPYYYEYKNELATLSPLYEYAYALPSIIAHVSPIAVDIAYKFLLPLLLTILTYSLFTVFIGRPYSAAVNAGGIAASLLVTLAYDVVDYRSSIGLVLHGETWMNTLLWNRPVNPVCGALLLFTFLISIFSLFRGSAHTKRLVTISIFSLGLMFASYYFSWSIALSILFFLSIFSYAYKKFWFIKMAGLISVGGVLVSLPYWYNVYRLTKSPWYHTSALLSGLLPSHEPIGNTLLLAMTVVLSAILFVYRRDDRFAISRPWVVFSFACIAGGFAAFNQQVLTGMAIWPFHFVQYTIPLVFIIFVTLIYQLLADRHERILIILFSILSICSIAFGSLIQVRAFTNNYQSALDTQRFGTVFRWLNSQTTQDSVVLVNDVDDRLSEMIPAYTHNNVYTARFRSSIIPNTMERFRHNYFTLLRLRGITDEQVSSYLQAHTSEVRVYLAMNWKDLFDDQRFTDVEPLNMSALIDSLTIEYGDFYSQPFIKELKKYRVDYIISHTPLSPSLALGTVQSVGEFFVYNVSGV